LVRRVGSRGPTNRSGVSRGADQAIRDRGRLSHNIRRRHKKGGHIQPSWINDVRSWVAGGDTNLAGDRNPEDGGNHGFDKNIMMGVLVHGEFSMKTEVGAESTKLRA
jgi:hypothetical protein